jgi:hypothetical protein
MAGQGVTNISESTRPESLTQVNHAHNVVSRSDSRFGIRNRGS